MANGQAINRRRLLLGALLAPAIVSFETEAKRKKRRRKHRRRRQRSNAQGPISYTPDSEELAFLALLNDYRAQRHVRRLTLQPQLGAAAEYHAQDMADNDYVDHTLSNGDSPLANIEHHGYENFVYWGEVIAAGFETAAEAISALKTSPSHDAMMCGKHFRQAGIGRAYNASSFHGWYWVVTFGGKS
jgi:uncharacterized protein YkwD